MFIYRLDMVQRLKSATFTFKVAGKDYSYKIFPNSIKEKGQRKTGCPARKENTFLFEQGNKISE